MFVTARQPKMSSPADKTPVSATTTPSLTLVQFADRFRADLIPLNGNFSYFCAASLPFTEEDTRDYLEEPVAALPPGILAQLPKISILIVPYLTREKSEKASVSMVAPPEEKLSWTAQIRNNQETVLAFTFNGHDVSEYHYRFYQHISHLIWDRNDANVRSRFSALLVEETNGNVHGEVDEDSWRTKQQLQRRNGKVKADSKVFAEYLKASFIDTMTLYLHGICCDIDVDTGPRQLPSRYLRKRLQLFKELFPPPAEYFVLPEDMKK
jgi:hypothetical protein